MIRMIEEIVKTYYDNGLKIKDIYLPEVIFRRLFNGRPPCLYFYFPEPMNSKVFMNTSDPITFGEEFPSKHEVHFHIADSLIVSSDPIKK